MDTPKNARHASAALRCALAVLLALTALLAALSATAPTRAWAADTPVSSVTWEEVKDDIEGLLGTPYVWGGKSPVGWDCSGFVGYVMANYYKTGWPGGSTGNCGTDAIAAFCAGSQVFSGSSADDYNAAFEEGTVKPGDIIVFSNSSGATVHCAIAGEDQSVYHAWSEYYGTCNTRFDYMWGINGGHGKAYASFKVYRGLSDGGYITLTKTSLDVAVTGGNAEYSLAGAVYGVYQAGALVTQITTDANGNGQSAEKLKNGTYVVKEIAAPAGFVLSDTEYSAVVNGADAHVDVADVPVTVRLTLIKQDCETLLPEAQGAASLDGAVYEATYLYNGATKTVTGTTEGATVVFEGIPLGTVELRETKAPTGYLPDGRTHILTVTADMAGGESVVFEYTAEGEFVEQVVRGDLELVKVSEGDHARLAGIPFAITSTTTNESHVIVTDANGHASTSASWNPHTTDTNGATAESGVWFGGGEPDDAKGALVYDTYLVEELSCEANADRELIPAFEVSVYRDSVTVNLGTLTNASKPHVAISKTDITTGEELPGATLQVLDSEGHIMEEWVSGTEAHEVVLPEGTYTLHEEIAPEGYLLATDIEFSVASGQVAQTVEMTDDYTKVDIDKQDAGTGESLTGAKLSLYKLDEDGERAQTALYEWESDGSPLRFERLEPGDYVLTETEAPAGYELAADIEFSVEATGEVQSIVMYDEALPEEPGESFDKTGFDAAPLIALLAFLAAGSLVGLGVGIKRCRASKSASTDDAKDTDGAQD